MRFCVSFPGAFIAGVGANVEAPGLRSLLVLEDVALSGLLHMLCWALGGLEAWVTLRLMGIAVTPAEALATDSLVTSLRTFGFFMPAAFGVQEAAYVLVCALFGLSPGEAMAFSLVRPRPRCSAWPYRPCGLAEPGSAARAPAGFLRLIWPVRTNDPTG